MKPIARILVPIDFTPGSEETLDTAMTLAAKFDGTIVALHVHEVEGFQGPVIPGAPALITEPLRATEDREVATAMAQMQRCLDKMAVVRKDLPEVELFERSGEPSRTIIDFAGTSAIDLIVMGTHGRTGLSHLMLGSVAERVVREASCPVLTIRIGERQAA